MRWAGRVGWVIFRCHFPKRSGFANSSCFQINSSSVLDPCVGDGGAFEVITSGAQVFRYGIELDAYRAEQARERIAQRRPGQYAGSAMPGRELWPPILESSLI